MGKQAYDEAGVFSLRTFPLEEHGNSRASYGLTGL